MGPRRSVSMLTTTIARAWWCIHLPSCLCLPPHEHQATTLPIPLSPLSPPPLCKKTDTITKLQHISSLERKARGDSNKSEYSGTQPFPYEHKRKILKILSITGSCFAVTNVRWESFHAATHSLMQEVWEIKHIQFIKSRMTQDPKCLWLCSTCQNFECLHNTTQNSLLAFLTFLWWQHTSSVWKEVAFDHCWFNRQEAIKCTWQSNCHFVKYNTGTCFQSSQLNR